MSPTVAHMVQACAMLPAPLVLGPPMAGLPRSLRQGVAGLQGNRRGVSCGSLCCSCGPDFPGLRVALGPQAPEARGGAGQGSGLVPARSQRGCLQCSFWPFAPGCIPVDWPAAALAVLSRAPVVGCCPVAGWLQLQRALPGVCAQAFVPCLVLCEGQGHNSLCGPAAPPQPPQEQVIWHLVVLR